MASDELRMKVGLKYNDPTKEYEFLDKLGEGYVYFQLPVFPSNSTDSISSSIPYFSHS